MPVPIVTPVGFFIRDGFEERFPIIWRGNLILRNDQTKVQMHLLLGNADVAKVSLPSKVEGETGPIRILQRIQLDQVELNEKIQNMDEHCILLAVPCGNDQNDLVLQTSNIANNFVDYLIKKDAAGIVTAPGHDTSIPDHIIHIFPACPFAHQNLSRADRTILFNRTLDNLTYLVIIITRA